MINGSFLIDEGRQGVESFEFLDISKLTLDSVKSTNVKNPGIAKETWNKLIAQYVVFPNLPNVFEKAISDCLINKEECGKLIPHTQLSIVDILPEEDIKACQRIADSRGVHLKVRPWEHSA